MALQFDGKLVMESKKGITALGISKTTAQHATFVANQTRPSIVKEKRQWQKYIRTEAKHSSYVKWTYRKLCGEQIKNA